MYKRSRKDLIGPLNFFNILPLNMQCLRNKTNELNIFLSDNNFDVLCINEHWLANEEIDHVNINDYILVSNFAGKNTIHGGLAIFSSKNYNSYPISLVNKLSIELHCEIVGIMSNNEYQIITVYRSPTLGEMDIFLQRLSSALNILSKKGMNTVVMGEFNVHFHNPDKNTYVLLNVFRSFGFFPLNILQLVKLVALITYL